MSKEVFARLITTLIQSQVGVRELGTRPMICVPGVFFSVRSGENYASFDSTKIMKMFTNISYRVIWNIHQK